jgi:hypothetical protein
MRIGSKYPSKAKIGRLYEHEGNVYVLLQTNLGFIAVDICNGNTYGGLRRTIEETVDGLTPTGYLVNLDCSDVTK